MSEWMLIVKHLSLTNNKHVCSHGIQSVPRRVCVCIVRNRNDEEDAKEFFSLVTIVEIPPEGLKGLGTIAVFMLQSCYFYKILSYCCFYKILGYCCFLIQHMLNSFQTHLL